MKTSRLIVKTFGVIGEIGWIIAKTSNLIAEFLTRDGGIVKISLIIVETSRQIVKTPGLIVEIRWIIVKISKKMRTLFKRKDVILQYLQNNVLSIIFLLLSLA